MVRTGQNKVAAMTADEFNKIVLDLDRHSQASDDQAALYGDGLSAEARIACLPEGEWLSNLHCLWRRHQFHAALDAESLWHSARKRRWQQWHRNGRTAARRESVVWIRRSTKHRRRAGPS
jgi:hypothetical protein